MTVNDRSFACDLTPALVEIAPQLELFEALLQKWQAKVNLIGKSTSGNIWSRHFADSAQLANHAALDKRWVDLGSGAGFPGVVIALLQRAHGGGEMHLIESDSRKAAFLREVSRETDARAIVHNARCEDALSNIDPEIICSRAMTGMPSLIGYARPFVEKSAIALFLKGRDVASELTRTPIPSNFSVDIASSLVDPKGAVVKVKLT